MLGRGNLWKLLILYLVKVMKETKISILMVGSAIIIKIPLNSYDAYYKYD